MKANRRERKAAQRRNYHQASWHRADHLVRYARTAKAPILKNRGTFDFSH
jgi:hypothetical protein